MVIAFFFLNKLKKKSVCERSVARILSVPISCYPLKKLLLWSIWIGCGLYV